MITEVMATGNAENSYRTPGYTSGFHEVHVLSFVSPYFINCLVFCLLSFDFSSCLIAWYFYIVFLLNVYIKGTY